MSESSGSTTAAVTGAPVKQEPEMKGWLYKWTNYIKGYQKRWFVLSNGVLSYYRSQTEVTHTCRGSIRLQGAFIHTEDSCNFVISNAGTNTFHLKAASEVERQRWVTALELAKSKAIRVMESEYLNNTEDEEDYEETPNTIDKNELQNELKTLSAKLEEIQTCNDLIAKQCGALQRALAEAESVGADSSNEALTKMKAVNERFTLFRITSSAMVNACSEYANLAQNHGRKWQRMLAHEHEQRCRLEEMVEQLARQHSHLEQAAQQARSGTLSITPNTAHSEEDDENEFFDAQDEVNADFIVQVPLGHRRTSSGVSTASQASEGQTTTRTEEDGQDSSSDNEGDTISVITRRNTHQTLSPVKAADAGTKNGDVTTTTNSLALVKSGKPLRKRRTRVPDKPNYPLNLWSIMKNCIGKELTKIPMPVNFSEPLSMLQRLVEDFEYSDLLDKAAACDDPCEQLAYVAAYTVSSYSTTSNRTGKPFNPLLGETYEWDRMDDLGWRVVSEQVSHHPPMVAQYCESNEWRCWQEFSMSSKFRGKYLQVIPLGISHLEFNKTGHHYTWRKVTTTVHNIIVGKLWVDQHGEMDIMNHKTGDKCHLKFIPYSYFARDVQRKVSGAVMNKDGDVRFVISGTWDNKIEVAKVVNAQGSVKGKPLLETETPKTVWKRNPQIPDAERFYNFTEFACQLNEIEEGVAPTDSRLRPDQRLMEAGQWDEANQEKLRLEEKQRAARKIKEAEAEEASLEGRPVPTHEPVWFSKQKDPITGNVIHLYSGKYWESKAKQDWAVCPDIF